VVSVIGDSTFIHSGITGLVEMVYNPPPGGHVVVILDNSTTAMTGNQPTPALGVGAAGEPTAVVDMESMVRACGIKFCKVGQPAELPRFVELLREAVAFSHKEGPAVVIAGHPCRLDRRQPERPPRKKVEISEACNGCLHCVNQFECPALAFDEILGRVAIDRTLCADCGVCADVCPRNAISPAAGGEERE
jgi:indolepyruvate ferredoxin oxidoreductase alpha subunit